MQVNSDKPTSDTVASDTVGPLNALEAERYVEELRTFSFETMGSSSTAPPAAEEVEATAAASELRDGSRASG